MDGHKFLIAQTWGYEGGNIHGAFWVREDLNMDELFKKFLSDEGYFTEEEFVESQQKLSDNYPGRNASEEEHRKFNNAYHKQMDEYRDQRRKMEGKYNAHGPIACFLIKLTQDGLAHKVPYEDFGVNDYYD
jgi:hypothetical protein